MNWEVENLNEMEVNKDGIIYIYIRWAKKLLAHGPKT
jgi:hypothetical protein